MLKYPSLSGGRGGVLPHQGHLWQCLGTFSTLTTRRLKQVLLGSAGWRPGLVVSMVHNTQDSPLPQQRPMCPGASVSWPRNAVLLGGALGVLFTQGVRSPRCLVATL